MKRSAYGNPVFPVLCFLRRLTLRFLYECFSFFSSCLVLENRLHSDDDEALQQKALSEGYIDLLRGPFPMHPTRLCQLVLS